MVNLDNMMSELSKLPLWQWCLIGIILFSQSIWLFRDAQKRNAKPWLWGIIGLIQFPCPLIAYLIIVRKKFRRNQKNL